jgi:cell division protein FtsX
MNDHQINPGVMLGAAAAIISVLAAMAALYLWSVNRARQKLGNIADPATRAVIPWLSPLLLPPFVILGLGFLAGLWHGL